MTTKIPTQRELRRLAARHEQELKRMVEKFVLSCWGKSEVEIKQKYKEYEEVWQMFAKRENNYKSGDKVTVFVDAFESAILNGYGKVKNLNVEKEKLIEYRRIFKVFKKKNIFEKIILFLKRK